MIGTGGSALVSKTIGEGNKEKKQIDFFRCLYTYLIIVGGILTIIGIPLSKASSKPNRGANGHILDLCTTYGKTILIFLIPFCIAK